MDHVWSILDSVVAGVIGTIIGFLARTAMDRVRKLRTERRIRNVLGFPRTTPKTKIAIIHSALFDRHRNSYNYPSCDMISARKLANLFESIDLKENSDFIIVPEANCLTAQKTIDPQILDYNLILLGGPKRNMITENILKTSSKSRFDMRLDDAGENRLYDNLTQNFIMASRDQTKDNSNEDMNYQDSIGRDFALIRSVINPLQPERRALILAGIHGPGTIGAANFITNEKLFSKLHRKNQLDYIEVVVSVEYDIETDESLDIALI